MGTSWSAVVAGGGDASREDARRAIEAALAEVDAQMSNWNAGSELSRFNAAHSTDRIALSPGLSRVLNAAQAVHAASDGQFDTTLGPLIELWGFGAHGRVGAAPGEAQIESALQVAGQGRMLRVGEGWAQKTQADAALFVPGIGKGYGIDRVASALRGLGFEDFLFEIGGDMYAAGVNREGAPWRIGLESPDPRKRALDGMVRIGDLGVATSGDYRNYFEQGGERFSHILDSRTGRPITHATTSATVLAADAMLADAWSTAMLALGRERGMEIARREDVAVLFVDRNRDGGLVMAPSPAFTRLQA
jgi:thiamine biosynthesis lipoprotein